MTLLRINVLAVFFFATDASVAVIVYIFSFIRGFGCRCSRCIYAITMTQYYCCSSTVWVVVTVCFSMFGMRNLYFRLSFSSGSWYFLFFYYSLFFILVTFKYFLFTAISPILLFILFATCFIFTIVILLGI